MVTTLDSLKKQILAIVQPRHFQLSHVLSELCCDSQSILDLGCGSGQVWQSLIPKTAQIRIGVDAHVSSLDLALGNSVFTEVHVSDILLFMNRLHDSSIDTVVALCVIEHMTVEHGKILANEMRRVARKRAVIFTPNGFVPQNGDIDNPAQAHLSGWTTKVLRDLGYDFYCGFNGLKFLRGTYGLPVLKPQILGEFIALLSAWGANSRPKLPFQILCVSDKLNRS